MVCPEINTVCFGALSLDVHFGLALGKGPPWIGGVGLEEVALFLGPVGESVL